MTVKEKKTAIKKAKREISYMDKYLRQDNLSVCGRLELCITRSMLMAQLDKIVQAKTTND